MVITVYCWIIPVTCSTMNHNVFNGEIELKAGTNSPVPHSADVVIVYEEKKTEMWTPITLGQLVQEINRALTASSKWIHDG